MRRALAFGWLFLLAACSNQGLNPIVAGAIDEVNPLGGAEAPAGPTRTITRDAITRADTATIRARLLEDETPTYLFGAAENGGFVTYASGLRQTLTLRGAQITASRGLGHDLLSAVSSDPDPLKRAIPPTSWPQGVTRSYEFPAWAAQGRIETYACRFEFGPVRDIEILDVRHRGIEVTETCSNDERSFENLYLADVNTGFVWRSIQWLGPEQGLVDLEIVLPFTGRRT
jgi:hypothetical protein